jgi:hypothetical protein
MVFSLLSRVSLGLRLGMRKGAAETGLERRLRERGVSGYHGMETGKRSSSLAG